MSDSVQRDFYDSSYAKWRPPRRDLGWIDRCLPAMPRTRLAASLLLGGGRVLDLGCGGGDLLWLVRDRYAELHGVDLALVQIERAKHRLQTVADSRVFLHALNIDAEPLPYPSGSFDAATCIEVMQFVFDVDRIIGELARVLRPGGQFLVETNNLAYLGHRLRLLGGVLPRTSDFVGWDGNTLHYFALKPLRRLLAAHGLEARQVRCPGRLHHLRALWPSLLGQSLVLVGEKVGPDARKGATQS